MPSKPLVLTAAALTATTLPLAAIAPAAQGASPAAQARGKKVAVYVQGDSLTVGSGPRIQQRLRGDVKSVSVDAQVGRFTRTGLQRVAQSGSARRAKVWVIALGTNDGPDPQALRRYVKRSLHLAGPQRRVIWLTVQRPGGYGRVNAMLKAFDRTNDRLTVIDWAGYVNAHPGLLGGDGVHATSYGYQKRGDMIAREALRLAQEG